MIQAPNRILDSNACVNELINYEANWWIVPLIKSICPLEVVEQIYSMAISPCLSSDQLIWSGTKSSVGLKKEVAARLILMPILLGNLNGDYWCPGPPNYFCGELAVIY
jgi:hypothetical protein